MSEILRMELRREIFFPLLDGKYENANYEEIEILIDKTLDIISENIGGMAELISSEEDLKQYCNSIHKEIEHFDTYRDGFITAIMNVQGYLQDSRYQRK